MKSPHSTRLAVIGGATVVMLLAWLVAGLAGGAEVEDSRPVEAPRATLDSAAERRVFFGHQSVGGNVIDAIPTVFADAGVAPPPIVESAQPVRLSGGFVAHALIGTNTDPLSKIRDFESILRGGVGDVVDTALMKLCYVDIDHTTDVEAVFDAYVESMARLERDYPDVTFLHSTVPLTTPRGLKSWARAQLGRDDHLGPRDNVAREAYNALVRAKYGPGGRLFDLARAESNPPGGQAVARSLGGAPYYDLQRAYASDAGHLNAVGASVVATELLTVIGRDPSAA